MRKLLDLLFLPVTEVGRLVLSKLKSVGSAVLKPLKTIGKILYFPLRPVVWVLRKFFRYTGRLVIATLTVANLIVAGYLFLFHSLKSVLILAAIYFVATWGYNTYLNSYSARIYIADLPEYSPLDVLPSGEEVFEELVKLEMDGDKYSCTGTVISNKYILTAGHCVDGELAKGEIKILNKQGQDTGIRGRAAAFNRLSDLGLILGDFTKFHKAPLAKNGFIGHPGPFIACGAPYGGDVICVPFTPASHFEFFIAGNGYLYPGMSGGPVYDQTTGEIVGVNSRVSGSAAVVAPVIGIFAQFRIKVR